MLLVMVKYNLLLHLFGENFQFQAQAAFISCSTLTSMGFHFNINGFIFTTGSQAVTQNSVSPSTFVSSDFHNTAGHFPSPL
jgi:hypothetical protein